MNDTAATKRRNQWLLLIGFSVVLGAVVGGTFASFSSRDGTIDPWWGLPAGTIFGLGMLLIGAVVLRRTTPFVEAMGEFDKHERKAVGRAVSRGEAVDDPRLAKVAVLLAEQQLSPFPGPEWLKNGTPFLVFGALLILAGGLAGRSVTVVIGVGLIGVGVLQRTVRTRVRTSLAANQRLLDA